MSTVQQNEKAIRRCVDLFNQRTLEWVDTCYAEDAECVALPMPGISRGYQGKRAFMRATASGVLQQYPDRQMHIRNLVAQDDQVVVELDWQGTAATSVGNLPAGAQVRFRVASFFTLAGGLITKQTDYCIPTPVEATHNG